jgi:ABC-2 type transport system permease protein
MIRAEFRKLLTVRGTWLLLGIAQLIVVAGVSGLMVQRDDPTSLTAQRGALAHVGLVALFSLLLGILATAGEHRYRTITDTFLATPRRRRLIFGLVTAVSALVTTELWLVARGAGLSAEVWRTLAGGVGWNVAFAVLGVGLGALITNLMAAVAAALAWLALVEGIVAQLIGDAGRWLPFALGGALEGLSGPPQWQAALALAGYAAAFVLAGTAAAVRRDVT